MRILGISAFYHDSAAALVDDGLIVAAAQEERFTRIKHDPSFPTNAVRFCLSQAAGPVDAVVYYEKPLLKFHRILQTTFATAPRGFRAFATALPLWLRQKLWIPLQIENELRAAGHDVRNRIHFAVHHESHAASAFYPSPFSRAAILTLDGVGEWATTTIGRSEDNRIELLREQRFPHSLGLLYSAFTSFCGFRVNSGEYKLMGLAPYGTPRYADRIREHLVRVHADGSFHLNQDYFAYVYGERMTNARFAALFGGPARRPEAPVTPRECDLARSIQLVTEEVVLGLARQAHALTGEENLCLAGGVALNCVANARLLREGPFRRIWVQPAAGDAGGALGAALAFHHLHHDGARHADGRHDAMRGAFLGPSFSDDEIAAALAAAGLPAERVDDHELAARIAEHLAAGEVVGFFQGRAEFGPRALGARSILADPRDPGMQRRLNQQIKFRESFRPFAPAVLAERAHEYFEIPEPSPYMLFTAPVRKERRTSGSIGERGFKLPQGESGIDFTRLLADSAHESRSDLPAITHVDGSARVQTVDATTNPALHAVLSAFADRTGCAVLVNTSFNVRGEPPVCHPREAIACFLATGMDSLALGPFFLEKRRLTPRQRHAIPAPAFAQD